DQRDDDGTCALHHPSGDPLTEPISRPLPLGVDADRGFDRQFLRLIIEQRYRAADDLMVPLQLLQNAVKRALQIERAGQGLADLEQRGEMLDIALPGAASHRGANYSVLISHRACIRDLHALPPDRPDRNAPAGTPSTGNWQARKPPRNRADTILYA